VFRIFLPENRKSRNYVPRSTNAIPENALFRASSMRKFRCSKSFDCFHHDASENTISNHSKLAYKLLRSNEFFYLLVAGDDAYLL